ncbi:MAG: relaxase/mobilization nuclease domain-containing protein [Ruminiclostridium sp.]|nr:relaxase/mobilization nuclease domain-containing protein [Ruminiclostridium sp.]
MAVTKIHAINTTMNAALDYIMNPMKTDDGFLVDGFHCTPEVAAEQYELTRRNFHKAGGKLGFHLIQSFAPGEIDYDTAHRIGMELADKLFGGRFQYVCATHIDRGHIHNHIISNSVSFVDGKKFYDQRKTVYQIRDISDKLCRENGLSVIEHPMEHGLSYHEYVQRREGQSWKQFLRENIDRYILQARSWEEFLELMRKAHYEVKEGKYISFRAEGEERFIRSKSLGSDYTEEQIRNRISGARRIDLTQNKGLSLIIDIENAFNDIQGNKAGLEHWAVTQNLKKAAATYNFLMEHGLNTQEELDAKISAVSKSRDDSRSRIKEIEARLKVISEDIQNIDNYRKTKPIADKLKTAVFKDKFRRENEGDLIIHDAAKRYIHERFPNGKLPLIKDLRAEEKALKAEKNKLYGSYYQSKDELSELRTAEKNLAAILGRNVTEKDKTVQRKKNGELE